MRKTTRREMLVGSGLALGSLCGCRTAPITGRRQLLLFPEGNELSLGETAYAEVVSKTTQTTRQDYASLVSQVGQRIAEVSGRKDYQWEFKTLAGQEQNAFCLPGGKVAVYEGIMPICQNEAGLAVVMSHEIAHALARHGGERMSQNSAVQGVKTAVGYMLQNQNQVRKELLLQAYGVATEYGVLLPYSRKHESEADNIGLMLMAQAGYDPEEAPRFWRRFSEAASGPKPPEFLSTHPSDERRAADLAALLPQAQALYSHAPTKLGLGQSISS